MPRPRGEAARIAERRVKVADGILRGETLRGMGRRLGVSHATIVSDIKAVHQQWLEDAVGSINAYKQQEVERHRWIISEAQAEFERSKQPVTKRETGTVGGKEIDKTIETAQTGNPAYLATIQRSSETIAKLLGLFATETHKHEFGGPAPGEADIFSMLKERIGSRN